MSAQYARTGRRRSGAGVAGRQASSSELVTRIGCPEVEGGWHLALVPCAGCGRDLLRPELVDARCIACMVALSSGARALAGPGARAEAGAGQSLRSPVPS